MWKLRCVVSVWRVQGVGGGWGVGVCLVIGGGCGGVGVGEIYMSNFRFVPQILGRGILLSMSKITPPNGSCAQDVAGITVAE